MKYRHAGTSGLKLPIIALGFWHNFGDEHKYEMVREMVLYAFDKGIVHFDLANNYGLPDGSAESNLGKIIKYDLKPYRDQLVISTKAGFYMWPGPYGDGGSRKYLLSSLDQSLLRMGLDYVDIFYSHRYDPDTPLIETMGALADAVRMGKALYVGLSNYPDSKLKEAVSILDGLGIKPVLYQPHYSLLDQGVRQEGSIEYCRKSGIGVIPFSIFNQGLLTGKYLTGIPKDSRMADPRNPFLDKNQLNETLNDKLTKFHELAKTLDQSMTALTLKAVLNEPGITSALVGVSRLEQLKELVEIVHDYELDDNTMKQIIDIFE
ncbi:MAG: aldo/keto reductase [Bacilli bacterium]|nr:aldo/keto reductase [Bacilli bacterium]MBN2696873.1 aldo/keto reductase [Bacilli bacterium]